VAGNNSSSVLLAELEPGAPKAALKLGTAGATVCGPCVRRRLSRRLQISGEFAKRNSELSDEKNITVGLYF